MYHLTDLNCCECQLFVIPLIKKNCADNANGEIEAYTDLGLDLQELSTPMGARFQKISGPIQQHNKWADFQKISALVI